ncbi:MFS transporter [Paenibacillus sp. J5C_2022]|uniref:staphylopine family metallophore export MFS transporter CntE n=1 Tax=Paenibacillus sp. J5C2022 TaxID=2977129 RepID=UPI0021CF9A2B|nr:MFS transporter [Paenibacillus sp. J5C2022]MCU6707391.1 MFS transporter [Paenibacillus sp. J5C2022]
MSKIIGVGRAGAVSKPLLRLYALALLFFSANAILNVIVPLQGHEQGSSHTTIGWIMGTYMLTCMLFRPWAGALIQRYGASRLLRLILLLNGLALIWYTIASMEYYVVARILQGICTAFFSMTLQLAIIDTLPEEERSRGISMYSLFTYIPTIAGPLAAVGIWEWGGSNAFTLLMIGIAVMTALFGMGVSIRDQSESHDVDGESEERQVHTMKQSHWLRSVGNRHLVVCSLCMLVASIVFGAVVTFMPLYAKTLTYGNAGLYLSLHGTALVATRVMLSKRIPSDGSWRPAFMALLCLGVSLTALLLSFGPMAGLLIYPAALLLGVVQAVIYPYLMAYLSIVLPKDKRNVLIGVFIGSADMGVASGGFLMGPVVDAVSYEGMYRLCAYMTVGMAAIAWMSGSWLRARESRTSIHPDSGI